MEFQTAEIIAASQAEVFAALTDLDRMDRMAAKAGIDLQTSRGPQPAWRASFDLRGRTRTLDAQRTACQAPDRVAYCGQIGGMQGELVLDLVAVDAQRTRLEARLDLSARTIPARLMLQTLKLQRGRGAKGFAKAMRKLAKQIGKGAAASPARAA